MDKQYRAQTIILADGTRVRVRPICIDDAVRLQAFVSRCSPRTIFLRSNMVRPAALSDSEAAYLTTVDYHSTMALVALTGLEANDQIVGVARYASREQAPDEAEAAIMVEDAYQQRGLGRQLVARLAEYARDQGLKSLIGNVLTCNESVQSLIRQTGLPAEYRDEGCGECQVSVSLTQRTNRAPNLPARAAARVGRSLQWHLGLAAHLAVLLRQS